MIERVSGLCAGLEARLTGYRRDFHRHAEAGWTEFRTASLIARRLADLGYRVQAGREVIRDKARMGLPEPEALERGWQRAFEQGGDPGFLPALRGGFTGVVGSWQQGQGPLVALRFDIDALEIQESADQGHRPAREGFVSINPGVAHACGHDGHAAVGLGVAEVLAGLGNALHGTVRLIFQPAEEGVRGARSMVEAGVVDGVDFLLAHHLFSGWSTGELTGGLGGYLATTKFDARFTGAPAHAAASPHEGKNALLAAATAVLNLHAIPPHRAGATRINIGRLIAGSGRNVIPAQADLALETRGETTELNEYVFQRAVQVIKAAAAMYDCQLEFRPMGAAQGGDSDQVLAQRVERIALETGEFALRPPERGGGSEDFTTMMERVQSRGGQATYIGVGADLGGWGHHTAEFDLDEKALVKAVKLLSLVALDVLGG